jgi:DNA-binding response OmpR family regulator
MNKKILLVEDDPFLIDIYTTKLSSSGFDAQVATKGEEAVRKMTDEEHDLVLLDVVLPQMDGWEILREVKEIKDKKGFKIFVLSNLSQKEEIEKGLSLGADKYLIKAHYTPSEVVEEIKEFLNC